MADHVGQRFGDYCLTRRLGGGGFGDVYLGEHVHDKTLAAVKVLQTRLSDKEDLKEFINEARTFRLKHPHIVQLLDFGIGDGDVPFLVMDYAPNGTLRQRHPRGTQLPLSTIVTYIKQVADALQYAHDQRLIHRDVKPENMLLDLNNEILLSDFGIAVVAHSTHSLDTHTGAGTISYMAPEQIRGKPRPASDQYALGIIVYEWLCGTRPFNGTAPEVATQHMFEPPPSLREKVPTIPPEVEQVVLIALEKEPEKRFRSVQAFAQALAAASEIVNDDKTPPAVLAAHIPADPLPDNTPVAGNTGPQQPIAAPDAQDDSGSKIIQLPSSRSGTPHSLPLPTIVPVPAAHPHVPTTNTPTLQRNTDSMAAVGLAAGAALTGHVVRPRGAPPTQGNAAGPGSPRRRVGVLLILTATILLALLVFGIIVYAVSGNLVRLTTSVPGLVPSTSITITPASKDVRNTYTIFGVTQNPDATQRQVQARLLSFTTPAQSKTANATAVRRIPGVQATGIITFYNGVAIDQQVSAGTTFIVAGGVRIVTDSPVDIPPANLPSVGVATVSAHALNPGVSGNIGTLAINTTCCSNGSIKAKNLTPFTGGQDPQNYTFVQQSDIDGVAKPLEASLVPMARQALQAQVHANERLISPQQCGPNLSSDHAAGDRASSVTVTVSATCTGEVYDLQAVQTIAGNLLRQEAARDPGAGYALTGNLVTGITQITVTNASKGTLEMFVQAEGVWVFQFSEAQKQALAKLVAGKSKSAAQALLLQQMGIAKVAIQVSGNGDTLPTDVSQISIVVLSVPGITTTIPTGPTISTTPTTGPGPGSPVVPTVTPIATVGRG